MGRQSDDRFFKLLIGGKGKGISCNINKYLEQVEDANYDMERQIKTRKRR